MTVTPAAERPVRRTPSIRIDTFRNRIAGTVGLLEHVLGQLEDLHVLAYDRHQAGQSQRVKGGERDYALDTHGDPKARELFHGSALKVLDAAEDLTVTLHEVATFFGSGQTSGRRDPTADATTAEVLEALAAQTRRRRRGEYQPAPIVAQHAVSEPASATAELDRLRAAVRKVHTQIEDSSRLTPVEFDALRRAIDPSFTRAKKKRNKGR